MGNCPERAGSLESLLERDLNRLQENLAAINREEGELLGRLDTIPLRRAMVERQITITTARLGILVETSKPINSKGITPSLVPQKIA